MNDNNKVGGKDAFDLFPDLMKGVVGTDGQNRSSKKEPSSPEHQELQIKSQSSPRKAVVPPPKPPGINWLLQESLNERAQYSEVPAALILMSESESRIEVSQVFNDMGYQTEFVDSVSEAIEKMKYVNMAAVVLHTGFGGNPEEEQKFHQHMSWLPMNKRRYIFYVRIGPAFHTLYDLEALAQSANLVVNDRNLKSLQVILRKGLQDYEALFGPFIKALKEYGKQ
jgi:hypothetical protein